MMKIEGYLYHQGVFTRYSFKKPQNSIVFKNVYVYCVLKPVQHQADALQFCVTMWLPLCGLTYSGSREEYFLNILKLYF